MVLYFGLYFSFTTIWGNCKEEKKNIWSDIVLFTDDARREGKQLEIEQYPQHETNKTHTEGSSALCYGAIF